MHCGGKRHDDLEPGMRCPMCGHVVMAEAEELEEISSDYGPDGYDPGRDGGHSGRSMTNREREEAAKRAKEKLKKQGINEAQEEVVEETISNDEWYQNELFESLKKRWTK